MVCMYLVFSSILENFYGPNLSVDSVTEETIYSDKSTKSPRVHCRISRIKTPVDTFTLYTCISTYPCIPSLSYRYQYMHITFPWISVRPIHIEQQKFHRQRGWRERLLRRATTGCPCDSITSEQPKSCTLVLRHPETTYLLHTKLELLWRLRCDASRLLRRAQTIATPHTEQLCIQPHQRWIPQRIKQVRDPMGHDDRTRRSLVSLQFNRIMESQLGGLLRVRWMGLRSFSFSILWSFWSPFG